MAACTHKEFGGGHSEREKGKEICREDSKQRELERERVGWRGRYVHIYAHITR